LKRGKLTAVVAVRKGSVRIKDKNLKLLGNTTLLERKLEVLCAVKQHGFLDEIIVNSDCDKMLNLGKDYECETYKREDYFASSECTNSEFHGNIAQTTDTDFIFLAPVCSPHVSVTSHINAIKHFDSNDYDSLTSVDLVKNHLWLDKKPINYQLDNVPNSQELPDVMKLNYAITLVKRTVMETLKRVISDNPDFYILDDIESIDIDTPFDFAIAKAVIGDNDIYDWESFFKYNL